MLFEEWLEKKKQFTSRSAGDVVSRIKRAESLLGLKTKSPSLMLSRLAESKAFSSLSVSVKSQLRRAFRLLSEFEGGR